MRVRDDFIIGQFMDKPLADQQHPVISIFFSFSLSSASCSAGARCWLGWERLSIVEVPIIEEAAQRIHPLVAFFGARQSHHYLRLRLHLNLGLNLTSVCQCFARHLNFAYNSRPVALPAPNGHLPCLRCFQVTCSNAYNFRGSAGILSSNYNHDGHYDDVSLALPVCVWRVASEQNYFCVCSATR